MEKFIVSARKYRPQEFDTVIGQAHITTTLKNAIKNQQLAHAFLFCGPRGVGKTTCARILAKTINCENQTKEGEACNKCTSCISFNAGTSLNYFELDGASNNSVDDIRSLVEQVRFVPQSGKYKVYVIDEVHMLSSSAFNAFLKTLEEPPPYAIFILATTEKHKILPTILSRCQIFDFKRITLEDTVKHLEEICEKEKITADKAALQIIAQKSEGCMRDSLSILDKIVSFTGGKLDYENTLEHLNILDAAYYFQLLDCMLAQDLSGAMLLYDSINRKGFEGDLVLNGFAEFIRNLLVCKDEKAAVLLEVVASFRDKYMETAKKVSPVLLISALNILSEAEVSYKSARNKRLHVELAIIKLCYLQQAITITTDGSNVVKKKLVDTAKPIAFKAIRPFTISAIAAKETKAATLVSKTASTQEYSSAKLIIESDEESTNLLKEKVEKFTKTTTAESVKLQPSTLPATVKPASTKLTALDKIRKQYKDNGNNGNEQTNTALDTSTLLAAWAAYVVKLKAAKNPAAQPFELATLRIIDENCFEAITANNIEKQFIDQDRNALYSFLKGELQNTLLQITVSVDENLTERPEIDIPLSSTQQFQLMTEQFPIIKELKERLGLDLDY